jgi:outer membrane protein OmpA-like peptidoglycan-associated protein
MQRHGSNFAAGVILALFVGGAVTQSTASELPHTDVAHSKDSPIVSRFAGSTIIGYQEVNYDEVALPMGALRNSEFVKTLSAKGKVTRIVYASPAGKTAAEVFANFHDSLQGSGFKLLYSCTQGTSETACGGYNFAHSYAEQILSHDSANRNAMIDLLYSSNDDVRFFVAEFQRGSRKVDVGLMVAQNGDSPAGVLLQVIESGRMPTDQVAVDSAAMSEGLQSEGKIALYGLQFATDSAALRPDSDATLKQMSELLHQQPKLKVYIVGHTDNSGLREHNVALSQQRAESVVEALTSRFGIASDRLIARGLASYSPVANNHNDADRAKNRRVEMVEQ